MNNNYLEHYGVPGMKWGVIRANKKNAKNEKLLANARKYDTLSSQNRSKSDKIHSLKDTKRGYRYARNAEIYAKSARKAEKHARNANDSMKRARAEQRANTYRYKEAKYRAKIERVNKTTGYGKSAMRYAIKSEKYAQKAAMARLKVSNNNYYIQRMKKKVNSLSGDDRKKVERYLGVLA